MPKHVACGLVFGHPLAIPVPDIDRTDFLLLLGANPVESNGSLATAPDWPGRLEAIRRRGGRIVVVDPRRTRTAEKADLHVSDPPRDGRGPARGHRARALRGGACGRGRDRASSSRASTTCARRCCRLHARARRVLHRRPGRDGRRARARARGGTDGASSTAASARTRPRTGRSRRGSSTSSTRSPATSTGRAARCSRTPRTRRSAAGARRVPDRPLDEPRARPARGDGRAPGVDARGRDRDAG